MRETRKSRAFGTLYQSEKQLLLFETPFERSLNPDNRWVILSRLIPWYEICTPLHKIFGGSAVPVCKSCTQFNSIFARLARKPDF